MIRGIGLILAFTIQNVGFSQTMSALETLRHRDQQIRSILDKDWTNDFDKRTNLMKILNTSFDYEKHARQCFGKLWEDMNTEQQIEALKLVTQLLRASSLSKIEQYRSEKIEYISEEPLGNESFLVLTLVERDREKWEVGYVMIKQGSWKIFDVIVEGSSTVEANHSAFLKEVKSSGIESLLEKLHNKADTADP